MCARLVSFLLTIVLAVLAGGAATAQNLPACPPPQTLEGGWRTSFLAACLDRNGRFAGGSQIMHLVPHKGQLYAANGYWEDKRNFVYGGKDPAGPWAQVLRLAGPEEAWQLDFELGPRHLRTELLKSLSFTQDAQGHPLPAPESVLLAATFDKNGSSVDVFTRNDDNGKWTTTPLISGRIGAKGEDSSVRAAAVYRDRVTGQEQVFLSVGIFGIFTGHYEPALPGRIRWNKTPEAGTATQTRILSIVEANDNLFFSEGTKVFRRVDGATPRYEVVADLSDEVSSGTERTKFQAIGGIRGLSAIDGPVPGKQSLIFMWHGGTRESKGCVIRLDPQPDGSYGRVQETCLATQISQYLGGAPVGFVLGAYNNFLPLRDPKSGERVYAIGMEAFIPASAKRWQAVTSDILRSSKGSFYAGALYGLRDAQGHWRVGEAGGKYQPGQRALVSIYTIALSPFKQDDATIYLGGYDANKFLSSDTAWVYSAPLQTLLGH